MLHLHISAKTNQKLTCLTPLATNRTPNRIAIRMENRMCRRPLTCTRSPFVLPTPATSLPYLRLTACTSMDDSDYNDKTTTTNNINNNNNNNNSRAVDSTGARLNKILCSVLSVLCKKTLEKRMDYTCVLRVSVFCAFSICFFNV
jgi:hypothetical protein